VVTSLHALPTRLRNATCWGRFAALSKTKSAVLLCVIVVIVLATCSSCTLRTLLGVAEWLAADEIAGAQSR
jgi:hypothetical protein